MSDEAKTKGGPWPGRITVGTLFTTGITWCGATLWPWLRGQAAAVGRGEPPGWPTDGDALLALTGLVAVPAFCFVVFFAFNVWRELAKDDQLYKDTASGIRRWSGAARNILGRWWDRIRGWLHRGGFTRRYQKELLALRSIVDIRGLVQMEANRLELDDVYVELRAATRDASHPLPLNMTALETRERASIWDHMRYLPGGCATVIVGAPGSGKTTLLKHILLTYARNRQWRIRVRRRVPFFLELRKFPKAIGKTKDPDLPAVLRKILETNSDLEPLLKSAPEDWLEGLLKSGRCVLLLDGLDEIPDMDSRRKVADWLDRQVNHPHWRGNLFLVTSRPAGYQACPLQNARALEVQAFDSEDTRLFVEGWYLANEVIRSKATITRKVIRKRASANATKLLDRLKIHPRLSALTSNPLLLTMICLMHELGELPGSRSQLYEEICQVHLERWRRNREVTDTFNAAQKLTVLRCLAVYLMTRGLGLDGSDSKRLSTSEMLRVAYTSLDQIGVAQDAVSRKGFFTDLQHTSGLWLEWEKDHWGFAHLSFQEYLCADQWFVMPETCPVSWAPLFEDSWWRETLLLYAVKAIDLRPLVQAALAANTPRSLALLFALQRENVTLPPELQVLIKARLESALLSGDSALFALAAEAWLLLRQEAYTALDESREVGDWVTEAEFRLFLDALGPHVRRSHLPPPASAGWAMVAPLEPVLGVWFDTAELYCNWLDDRFPRYRHRLLETADLRPGGMLPASAWLTRGTLEPPNPVLSHQLRTLAQIEATQRLVQTVLNRHGLARSPARFLELIRELDRPLVTALGLSCFTANFLAYALGRALDVDLQRARRLVFGLDLDLDIQRGRELAHDLARELMSKSPPDPLTRDAIQAMPRYQDPIADHRRSVLLPLVEVTASDATLDTQARGFRRFFLACVDAVREADAGRVARIVSRVEDVLRLLDAREAGMVPRWEGIRVVRTRH